MFDRFFIRLYAIETNDEKSGPTEEKGYRMKKVSNIKHVAELAQVSISTVSRVLNQSANVSDELRERVNKAIEETRYSLNPIASTLKSAKRNQIAIVLPSLRQTFYTDIIKGASDFCSERQIMPLILESSGEEYKEQKIIENLEKQWVDGILFIPSKNQNTPGYLSLIESLTNLRKQDSTIPVVLLESSGLSDRLDCVRVDYEKAFYQMTYHLLEIGRRRLGYISCPSSSPLYDLCRNAFDRAIDDFGVDRQQQVVEHAEYTVLAGYQAMQRILEQDVPIDGIVCINDQVAAGALHACKESNHVNAENIAIVGFGGVAMSIITTPSITTMVAPRYDLGREAAKLLFRRIEGDQRPPEELVLSSHMAIRESTLKTARKNLDTMFYE